MEPYVRVADCYLSRRTRRAVVPLDRSASDRLRAHDQAFFYWSARQSAAGEMPIPSPSNSSSPVRRSLARRLTRLARSLDPASPVTPAARGPAR